VKKHIILLSFFSLALLTTQIDVAQAVEKTYDWIIWRDDIAYNMYYISLQAPDSWQAGTWVDVTFRLTLVYKIHMFDCTKTNWVKILLRSENFQMDSGHQLERVILRNVGDYWETKVSFYLPVEKVKRGQTVRVSVAFVTSIEEIDNIQWRSWEQMYVWSYDKPMYVSLFRPALSASDLWIVAMAVIAIGGISGFAFYRKVYQRKKLPAKPSLTEIIEEIKQARK